MTVSATEQQVLDAVEDDAIVATVAELVVMPSLSGQETPAQEHAAAFLRAAGLDVDVWDIDMSALSEHPHFSAEVERSTAVGVVAGLGRGDGPTLLLNGHVDVVPPGDPEDWTYPPWSATLADGRIYGRGAVDMKGGLACALHAAKAIADAGIDLAGRLLVAPVVGEEDGGSGSLALLEHGVRADAAIVLEPTALAIAPAQAGALSFRLTVRGLSAHVALREEGVSAFEKYLPLHAALLELEAQRNRRVANPAFAHLQRPFAICVGRVEAGDWPSSEADWLRAEGRYGVSPEEDLDTARAALEAVVAQAADADPWLRDHPPVVQWLGGQFHPAVIANDHPLVGLVAGAHTSVSGRGLRWREFRTDRTWASSFPSAVSPPWSTVPATCGWRTAPTSSCPSTSWPGAPGRWCSPRCAGRAETAPLLASYSLGTSVPIGQRWVLTPAWR